MLARTAGKLRSLVPGRSGSRSMSTKAPRRPDVELLKAKYGEHWQLFHKELHPHIKYFDACTSGLSKVVTTRRNCKFASLDYGQRFQEPLHDRTILMCPYY